jgi:DNA-binding LytR/AlgR family response regulator
VSAEDLNDSPTLRPRAHAWPILFITGYAENALMGNGNLEKGMHVLAKPFEVERLATKIRELVKN